MKKYSLIIFLLPCIISAMYSGRHVPYGQSNNSTKPSRNTGDTDILTLVHTEKISVEEGKLRANALKKNTSSKIDSFLDRGETITDIKSPTECMTEKSYLFQSPRQNRLKDALCCLFCCGE